MALTQFTMTKYYNTYLCEKQTYQNIYEVDWNHDSRVNTIPGSKLFFKQILITSYTYN